MFKMAPETPHNSPIIEPMQSAANLSMCRVCQTRLCVEQRLPAIQLPATDYILGGAEQTGVERFLSTQIKPWKRGITCRFSLL